MKFRLVESDEEKYKKILDDVSKRYDLTGREDGGKCWEVSKYIEEHYDIPQVAVSIWDNNWEWSSINGHYANLDGDKIIDFTIQQYAKDIKKDVDKIKVPNIAKYNEETEFYESDLVTYNIEEE